VGGQEVKLGTKIYQCAKVDEPGTGTYKNAACTETGAPAEYIDVAPLEVDFAFTIGASGLTAGSNIVSCTLGSGTGELVGETNIGKVQVKLTGCKSSANGVTYCTAKNLGGLKAGEIITNTLKGLLGEVRASEAASGVGILIAPASGKRFVVIEGNSCTEEAAVDGNVAAEVTPVGSLQSTEDFAFKLQSGKQAIQSITVKSVAQKPKLEAYGIAGAFEQTLELTFKEPVEVT
jgi:hypothetical protein